MMLVLGGSRLLICNSQFALPQSQREAVNCRLRVTIERAGLPSPSPSWA